MTIGNGNGDGDTPTGVDSIAPSTAEALERIFHELAAIKTRQDTISQDQKAITGRLDTLILDGSSLRVRLDTQNQTIERLGERLHKTNNSLGMLMLELSEYRRDMHAGLRVLERSYELLESKWRATQDAIADSKS